VLLLLIFLISVIPPSHSFDRVDSTPEFVLLDTNTRWIESDVDIEQADITVYRTGASYDGYNLITIYEFDSSSGNYSNVVAIMDMDGNVIASQQLGREGGAHCPAEFIDPNTVMVGSSDGVALWHLDNNTLNHLGFRGHHEYEYNPNNNTILTFWRVRDTIDSTDYIFDEILEYTLNGTLVSTWNVSDFVSESWWCPYHDMWNGGRDITHSNTIYYVPDEDIIYYNSRNTNTFWKLNYTSKEVIWGLGEYGNFTLYDLQGRVCDNLFYHAHSVEPIDEDTFILFDNDYHNQSNPSNQRSRVVEITIDEDTMTANETWYYEASSTYYSAGWGDADLLPNGDRLGAFGYVSSRVGAIEVNSDHETTWQLTIDSVGTHTYGFYRMERFRQTPTLSSPDDIVSTNSSYSLSWDAWYNYRNKQDLPGNYTLYIDDVPTQTGEFSYRKYWKPSNISIDTGHLSLGLHNVTLEVDDGYGNKNFDTVSIQVNSFYISRTGRTFVEKGQVELLPTWSGFTNNEMVYNITLDGSLYEDGNWTSQDIVLDPTSIPVGAHNIHFRLFNNSEVLYDDPFVLHVYSTAPPIITPLQASEISIHWGDPLSLSWNISDASPQSWVIQVNDVEVASSSWNNMTVTLTWDVPQYSEGLHNITIIAFDLVNQWTKSETNLTVNPPPEPHILSGPDDQVIVWGVPDTSFEWEVYNTETWSLWRNGIQFDNGAITSGTISFTISDWYEEGWFAGLYNLTLVATKGDYNAYHTFWLDIRVDPGDAYADAVVEELSESYLYGNNSLGAPDGLVSTIYMDYHNGYLTLDMGENEEIIDGVGEDLAIHARGGEYLVYVTNNLSTYFTYVGVGVGYSTFELDSDVIDEARYVRVTYYVGDDIELDAVEALNYNTPPSDTDDPYLLPSGDYLRMKNGTSVLLTWIANDETPWTYEIFVNSQSTGSVEWNGSNIEYLFEPTAVGLWNVTVVAYDLFGNVASDTLMIDVYDPATEILFPALVIGIGAAAAIVIIIVFKKRKSA